MDQLRFNTWKVGTNIAELCEHCERIFQYIQKGNSCNILANHTQ